MDISGIVLQGLSQAQAQLEHAAVRIAGAGASSVDGMALDTVDLSAEIVALMSAQSSFEANVQTARVSEQVHKSAIDILA